MPLSSAQLEAFVSVAEARHFTRAADRLRITQSALSQRILNLERTLETTLLVRDREGLRLTDAGAMLLHYCKTKDGMESELLTRLRSGVSDEAAGVMRIAGFSSVVRPVLLPALAQFLGRHPRVRVYCATRELARLPRLLMTGEADFMVLDRVLERTGVAHLTLGEEHNVLVQRKGYRGGEVYLDHDEDDQTSYRYFRQVGLEFRGERHYLDDVYGLLDGVKHGLGRAVLPKHLIRGDKGLEVLNPRSVLRTPVVLHFREQPYYSTLHRLALDALRANCPKLLAG